MGYTIGLHVTVREDEIIVTLPGTWFMAVYRKSVGYQELVATQVGDDKRTALKKADFLVRASRVAKEKARELGWIVCGLGARRAIQNSIRIRFATIDDFIFAHSAFPTPEQNAVFLGPDTYRFIRLLRAALVDVPPSRPLRLIDK